jgi:hypothetical protein
MDFEELLDRVWGYDCEVFAHDCLAVFKNYRTREEVVFHNCPGDDIDSWFRQVNPILIAYNCNNYDKHIIRCWVAGMSPEELKHVNDYIIGGNNGWDFDVGYIDLPTHWDLFNEINPRKALKEIEGNLRLDITETTIPFDLPTKWTDEQYKEVLYYCEHDVDALFPLFDKLKTDYKSKYIISKLGKIDPVYGLSQTNANLTALLLKAKKQTYQDNFKYEYPSIIDKSKIPKAALDYFDDIIAHNSLEYNPPAPELEFKDIFFQIGIGGGHAFKKHGHYYYDRSTSKKLLCNWDFSSLYPNIVRIFGYSSRSQSDKQAYVDLLSMRMKAKKGLLGDDFLGPIGLTNDDLKIGLKLPLNAYTGALRAKFNDLYDNLQGFSICTTGQLIVLQLIHDLEKVPTLEMVSANTDAVMYEVAPEYKEQADKLIHDLEKLTGLEMEEDNIVRIIMRDVNNYCELVQTGEDDYAINYKGSVFECNSIKKNLKLKWDKESKTWSTSFTDDIKANSRTICGEAILKQLLLDIPVEETINNCDDIFRFQIISHLGSTYQKCVLRDKDGNEIELQRNNRIYAGIENTGGKIYKVKEDGRYDSLAMCPPNPVVDNDNKMSIEKVNKKWYNKYAKQKISDFIGEGGIYMEEKLENLKKSELIEKYKELSEKVEGGEIMTEDNSMFNVARSLYHKINDFRKMVRERNFILDMELPNNLGATEYASIEQYYQAVQEICLAVGLDFAFETQELTSFDLGAFKPANGAPQNIATVDCVFTLTDIDTGASKTYNVIAQGSDSIDKAVNGATTYAFRNWFNKNFSPCIWNGEKQTFGNPDAPKLDVVEELPKTEPKTKVFVSKENKEAIKEEVVATPQKTDNKDDIEKLTSTIMKYRELSGKEDAGAKKLEAIMNGTYTDADILSWTLSFENALEKLGA